MASPYPSFNNPQTFHTPVTLSSSIHNTPISLQTVPNYSTANYQYSSSNVTLSSQRAGGMLDHSAWKAASQSPANSALHTKYLDGYALKQTPFAGAWQDPHSATTRYQANSAQGQHPLRSCKSVPDITSLAANEDFVPFLKSHTPPPQSVTVSPPCSPRPRRNSLHQVGS